MADDHPTPDDELGLPQIVGALEGGAAVLDREIVRARAHQVLFAEQAPPVRIGRYVVLDRLGAGGMGVVYAAYDPALDRKVALKVLRSRDPRGQQRMLREARALAQLSHHNVVAVHDVGTVGEGDTATVFIAMELVHGATLGDWIADEKPAWRTRLEVLVQAGRGLAAAHAAGLIHRDFKPDNVMVSNDPARGGWRARVMDFGLVRAPISVTDTGGDGAPPSEGDVGITQQGMLLGTPAYMAPEQLDGSVVAARTDQFGFCVTSWEALYRVRPFAGDTPAQVTAALLSGEPALPKASSDVPAWVHRVLARGLSRDPTARFPSMDELLAALGDDPSRRRRRWAAGLAVVATIAGVLGGSAWLKSRERAACARDAAEIEEVWNDEQRARMRAAIAPVGSSYGADTWSRVEPRIDDYATRWSALREQSCLAGLTGERTPDVVARGEACLAEHRIELAATVESLSSGDELAKRDAVPTVLGLPDVDRCDQEKWLAGRPSPVADPELRHELDGLRAELARASRLMAAHHAQAADILRVVLARATELEWAPLQLEAHIGLAQALARGGDFPAAVEAFRATFALAVELGDDDIAATAASRLVFTEGSELGRVERAESWSEVAQAFLARSDPEQGLPTATWLNSRGALARRAGRYADARNDFEQVTAIRERVVGLDHPQTLGALENVAVVLFDQGDYDAAAATLGRVVEARARLLGPEHPDVAMAMSSQAAAFGAADRLSEALAVLHPALAIEERALGPTHPALAATLHNIGHIQTIEGDYVGALATERRELAILEANPHGDPSRVGRALVGLAIVHGLLDRPSEGKPLLLRACTMIESSLGLDHPQLAICLTELAELHRLLGELDEELTLRRRVLAINDAALGETHGDTALSRSDLGAALTRTGDTDGGLSTLRVALMQLISSEGVHHPNTVSALQHIGQAHHQRGELVDALRVLRGALALEQSSTRPNTSELALAHALLGMVLVDLHELTQASGELRLAVDLAERSLGVEHSTTAYVVSALADAERRLGRLDDAEAHARSARAVLQRADTDPSLAAEAELVLGEILRDRHRDTDAREHIDRACTGARPPHALRLRRCPERR